MDQVQKLLKESNLPNHLNQGICIAKSNYSNSLEFAIKLLDRIINQNSLLLLSGGRTPFELYQKIAKNETLIPGSVGQIDERFGEPFHNKSNQKMFYDSGLIRYLNLRDIPFHSVLKGIDRESTSNQYDLKLRELFNQYQKIIGILGIGSDGHTAGIPSINSEISIDKSNDIFTTLNLVTTYDDKKGNYKERITMTFNGLSYLDLLIVLVFGDDKKIALKKMFNKTNVETSEMEIPSRFYLRPNIASKTLFITDQNL